MTSRKLADTPNRLIAESSPYLRQHAHNPVDWYPWGEEALRAAREQDKPLLLSIGYSACHWCHVMERESFETPEIAALMNQLFINVKVDREERPDLDGIYMDYVQLTTGSGGWPLTVFLTPDQVPFYGGTYYPPRSAHGRPGFPEVLEAVARAFKERRADIEAHAQAIRDTLAKTSRIEKAQGPIEENLLDEAFQNAARQFDNNHGGFGAAPKFPSAMVLSFLLRYHHRTNSARALEMVELSLQQMARGGIYDQLGGGFHRYSVDAHWLVPHFEKMLYDNALLSRLYLEAFQMTGNGFYREIAEETLGFIEREMLHPSGGFFSALDADSEGHEGKYYIWSRQEVEDVLGSDEAALFCDYFDVTESGNYEAANILHHRLELLRYAQNLGIAVEELVQRLDQSRGKLFEHRQRRVRPGLDDKILCAWNGMMLAAFSHAAFVLKSDRLLGIARRNARFLVSELGREGRLHRVWKDGIARLNGYLEDYALAADGLLTLYQASGESEWLFAAEQIVQTQVELFGDGEAADFYFTSSDHESLLVRQKEYLDNATPGGNSVSCLNLLRLAELLDKTEYHERAAAMLQIVGKAAAQYPLGFGQWLQALDFFIGPVNQVAIVGPADQREPLVDVARRNYLPNVVLALADTRDDESVRIPVLENRGLHGGKPAAYVCRNYTCSQPVTSAPELEALLL
jgi:uncharacterized protein